MKELTIYNIANGKVVPLSEVSDEIFASNGLGEGYVIIPNDSDIYAPVSGMVSVVFDPNHAFGIRTKHQIEVLVHMGIETSDIDTRELFDIFVHEGDYVQAGDLVASMNLESLSTNKVDIATPVVITSMDCVEEVNINQFGELEAKTPLGTIKYK